MNRSNPFYVINVNTHIVQALLNQQFPELDANVLVTEPTLVDPAYLVIHVSIGESTLAAIMNAIRPLARDFGYGDSDIKIKVDDGLKFSIPIESYVPSISRVMTAYHIEDLMPEEDMPVQEMPEEDMPVQE